MNAVVADQTKSSIVTDSACANLHPVDARDVAQMRLRETAQVAKNADRAFAINHALDAIGGNGLASRGVPDERLMYVLQLSGLFR